MHSDFSLKDRICPECPTSAMKTWETICNIGKNNKLHIIFSRKMILRSSMMTMLCSLRSSFRGAGSRRYRPSSPTSMAPRILSSLFLVLCPSASSCDIPPPSSCTLVLVFVFSRSKAQPHHPPVDGRSSTLAAESSLHTGCTEYTPAFDYSVICLRARTESPNMPAFEALTCTCYSHRGDACLMSTALTQLHHHTTTRAGAVARRNPPP